MPTTSRCRLYTDDLGELVLDCPDYVVGSIQIGSPAPRPVVRKRPLMDGLVDSTHYVGGRVATLALMLGDRQCIDPSGATTMQQLYDRLAPYMAAFRRPLLSWSLAGSPDDVRALQVRGVELPLVFERPRGMLLTASFEAADAYMRSVEQHCRTVPASSDTVGGRAYDLTFDRTYPAALPSGTFTITNGGNAPADWTATIFGPITNPTLIVNGTSITFASNGGVTLLAGQTLVIDTQGRTILADGDPGEPRLNRSNFLEWGWHDILLAGGDNTFRLTGTGLGTGAALTVCWHDRWH